MKMLKNYLRYALIMIGFMSCNANEITSLPAPPIADFDIQTTANPNIVLLTNKTPDAFLFNWDLGNGTTADSSVVEAYYPFKGTYSVTLQAFNSGGFGTIKKDVVIDADDPNGCVGNIKILSSCSTKVWKLDPNAGALKVGPDAEFLTVWWQNSLADVATRICMFNDEYTFGSDGTFTFDNLGDFWADADNSGNVTPPDLGVPVGCNPATAWPEKYLGWSSGVHSFVVNETELTVNGTGAFIGLYKVANGKEVTEPQESITYTLKEITDDKIALLINFGVGYWQFTLVPK